MCIYRTNRYFRFCSFPIIYECPAPAERSCNLQAPYIDTVSTENQLGRQDERKTRSFYSDWMDSCVFSFCGELKTHLLCSEIELNIKIYVKLYFQMKHKLLEQRHSLKPEVTVRHHSEWICSSRSFTVEALWFFAVCVINVWKTKQCVAFFFLNNNHCIMRLSKLNIKAWVYIKCYFEFYYKINYFTFWDCFTIIPKLSNPFFLELYEI